MPSRGFTISIAPSPLAQVAAKCHKGTMLFICGERLRQFRRFSASRLHIDGSLFTSTFRRTRTYAHASMMIFIAGRAIELARLYHQARAAYQAGDDAAGQRIRAVDSAYLCARCLFHGRFHGLWPLGRVCMRAVILADTAPARRELRGSAFLARLTRYASELWMGALLSR